MTVFDNLLVATNVHDASGLFGGMLVSRRSLEEERKARGRVARVTILLIEHDVQMVTGVSDYMYVIDQGRLIAQVTRTGRSK